MKVAKGVSGAAARALSAMRRGFGNHAEPGK
jgi:hypothetical protein